MSTQNQPFELKFNGSGAQTLTTSSGAAPAQSDFVTQLVLVTPQAGPPVPIAPNGTPLDMTVNVLNPYSLTTPPGAIRVG